MKRKARSKSSLSRKSSGSFSNQCKRPCKTRNNGAQAIERLNTNQFDSYISILWEKIPAERRFSCTCVDPMWFLMYFDEKCKEKKKDVLRWMSREKIFTKRYVFVPICQYNHWNLLILCNLGEDLDSNTKSPCILLLDSLQEIEGRYESNIRKFLLDLYANEKREESKDCIYGIPFRRPEVPQQQDGSSCGYYVLYYIYRFLMSCPDNFNMLEHYPGFLKKDWFSGIEFQSFYDNLPSLCKKTGYGPSNEESEIKIIDDLKAWVEVEKVDNRVEADIVNKNEREMAKDDDGEQDRKDAKNELEKNDENNSPIAKHHEHQEQPALVSGNSTLLCSKHPQVPLKSKGTSEDIKKQKAQQKVAQITPTSNVQKLDPAMATEEESIHSALPPENTHVPNSSAKKTSFPLTLAPGKDCDVGIGHASVKKGRLPFSFKSLVTCLKSAGTDHWDCSICQMNKIR